MKRVTAFGMALLLATALASVGIASPASAASKKKAYTLAQVQKHNTPTDCWSVVGTKVYNLTTWISRHPGGSGPIMRMCGTDATQAFTAQHGGASRPAAELARLQIGRLR